jgi:spermidine synthase
MPARGLPITLAVFVSGAVLLGLELAASRVLAPYFGSSLIVWGALIGVVLAGLSGGYWIGGSLVDRWPKGWLLVATLAAGAGCVLAVPFLDRPVLEAVVAWDPEPRVNALLAALCLFLLPSVVLAAATPMAVRLRTDAISRLGRTAGRLFAVSTAGSIVGTIATAFWLVPEFGTDQLIAFGAVALLAAAAVIAAAERLTIPFVVIVLGIAGAAAAAVELETTTGGTLSSAQTRNYSPNVRLRKALRPSRVTKSAGVLYEKNSRYHRIVVADEGGYRTLFFDALTQSAMQVKDPYATAFSYTDYLHLVMAYKPSARRVLFLGLGGGSAPKRFWRDYPQLQIDVAEVDPDVVTVARRYFAVPTDPRLRIKAQDGRRFLAESSRRYDAIVVDTYYSDSVPFHMTTREFVELARERLTPGGAIAMNVIGSVRGSGSKLFRALYRTYRTEFPTVVVHPVDRPDSLGNIILLATEGAAPAKSLLAARWRELRARTPTAPDLSTAISTRYDAVVPTADVPTLTDDYAPTDSLLLFD